MEEYKEEVDKMMETRRSEIPQPQKHEGITKQNGWRP